MPFPENNWLCFKEGFHVASTQLFPQDVGSVQPRGAERCRGWLPGLWFGVQSRQEWEARHPLYSRHQVSTPSLHSRCSYPHSSRGNAASGLHSCYERVGQGLDSLTCTSCAPSHSQRTHFDPAIWKFNWKMSS